ncbi:MAG: hypothetical protein FGM54_08545 [Chitinophagaceae bacterium]|nr:hypothetical protein [Chitinophagaceae bacterium]
MTTKYAEILDLVIEHFFATRNELEALCLKKCLKWPTYFNKPEQPVPVSSYRQALWQAGKTRAYEYYEVLELGTYHTANTLEPGAPAAVVFHIESIVKVVRFALYQLVHQDNINRHLYYNTVLEVIQLILDDILDHEGYRHQLNLDYETLVASQSITHIQKREDGNRYYSKEYLDQYIGVRLWQLENSQYFRKDQKGLFDLRARRLRNISFKFYEEWQEKIKHCPISDDTLMHSQDLHFNKPKNKVALDLLFLPREVYNAIQFEGVEFGYTLKNDFQDVKWVG